MLKNSGKEREKKYPAKHGAFKGVLGMSHNVVSCIQTVVVCVVGVRGRGLPEQGCLTVVFL